MILDTLPEAPRQEDWTFIEELKQPRRFYFHWPENEIQPDNTLDVGMGLEFRGGFPDPDHLLETAGDDLVRCLESAGIYRAGGIPVITCFEDGMEREAFRLDITGDAITVSAGNVEGIRRGIYFLEDRLRESRFPAFGTVEKEPWLKNRISRCFFGPIKRPPFNRDELMDDIDYYPDEYLNRLAHEGINGLWLTVSWRDICKTGFTELAPGAERRLAKLRRTVEKCRRYGIKIWVFCIEPQRLPQDDPLLKEYPVFKGGISYGGYSFCTATEEGRQYIHESVKWIFEQVPGLGGMLNISHGERTTNCLTSIACTSGNEVTCPRCARLPKWRIMHNTLSAMRRGMTDAAPQAELISWLYMPQPEPRAEWVFELASHIPEGVILQYNFESNGKKKQLDRYRCGGDYWLSFVGPSDDFARIAQNTRTAGTELSAKIQVGCSHEVATVPFVPVPGLLYRKYRAMYKAGVGHVMQCWYFGNYPGLMNRAAGMLAYEKFDTSEDEFLERLARPEWGPHAAAAARAWREFSDAYAHYPLSNMVQYYGPFHAGPVWPLYLFPVMKPLAPTWKPDFPPSGDAIGECLENHTLEEVMLLADRMSEGWQRGLAILKQLEPYFTGNRDRLLDIGVAEALGIQFAGAANIFRFYYLRKKFLFEHTDTLSELESLVHAEIANSKRLKELCLNDSRLGFHSEAESHLYHPALLDWRINQLENLLVEDFNRIPGPLVLNTPEYKIGSGEVKLPTFSWSVEWRQNDLLLKVTCPVGIPYSNDMVIVQALDIAGTTFPWLLCITPDNQFTDNRNAAEIETILHGAAWEIKVRFPGLFWQNDPLKRPRCFRIVREVSDNNGEQTKSAWPEACETPRHRLNLGEFSPEAMGLLI